MTDPVPPPTPRAGPSPGPPPDLGRLVDERHIILCCGSGGVGKTTTAAAIAVEGARRGRRTVVVTIDPAKRLANAMGLEGLSNRPSPVAGPWPGELWAVMLDTKGTFDDLVHRYSVSEEQALRILDNRFYRNISGALSGTQEYMAAEKLYELHDGGAYDLVVVDTPPTRHALDFLDAPGRLTRFLDHRLYRLLTAPGRAYLRAVNVAAQTFLRSVTRTVGGDVLADVIAFFQAFEGMEAGFRARAGRVMELLTNADTAYVLIASPRRDTVDEAIYFARKLEEHRVAVAALVVNRLHPEFGVPRHVDADRQAALLQGTALGSLWSNLAELTRVAVSEREQLVDLTAEVTPAPVQLVPFLGSDVHDLDGLAEIGEYLFGPAHGADRTGGTAGGRAG